MRQLTLNEKINIKADLSCFGIPQQELAKLNMKAAMFFGDICHRNPGAHFCRINNTKTDLSRLRRRLAA